MTYLLQYGSYVFPNTFTYQEIGRQIVVPATKVVHFDGARVSRSFLDARKIQVRGSLLANTGTALQTQRDAMKAALAAAPQNLYLESGRYLRNCYVDDAPETYDPTWPERITDAKFTFLTGDPFFYETAVQSFPTNAIAASPTTISLTAGGNATAAPALALTVGGAGVISLSASLVNNTTGESFTLVGSVMGGDVITVDTLALTVRIGSTDRYDLFDGLFPHLAVGANSLVVTYGAGTLTNLSAVWQNRAY